MRTASMGCIVVLALTACLADAQILEATYDGSLDAVGPEGSVAGELIPPQA